jgi:hypothetical protein
MLLLRAVCSLICLYGDVHYYLVVECPDGRYFGSLRAPEPVYNHVLEFLKHYHGEPPGSYGRRDCYFRRD